MAHRYRQGEQWARINRLYITDDAPRSLANFKSSKINYKIALWDPEVNGVRYLKTLIYNLAAGLGQENLARLRRVENRGLGNPTTVDFDGEAICIDYLMAVLELESIAAHVDLHDANILEIGAGYGRTCHTILSNHSVAAYYVIDLDNALALAREYLGAVLDESRFAKIHFLSIDDVGALAGVPGFDVAININSFAEMSADTVHDYLALIDEKCEFFYTKNPVGKYLDKSLDNHSEGSEAVSLALQAGLLRDVIDIHDNRAVKEQSRVFVDAYRPGSAWTCAADSWAPPWSYYWQAIYRRDRRGATPSTEEKP